jgi:RNA polymerase sigma-70 factor (ECF subfamily)
VYCVIPRDLAPVLHELLRRHFSDSEVEVIVERRASERRTVRDRRERTNATAGERRLVRAVTGRRVGERRVPQFEVIQLELPRRARPFAERLVFIERLEPSTSELEELDSARLVMRFQQGDREAFALLYMRYFDRVYRYLRFALTDAHDAEDAAQQVFTRVLEALPRYERRPSTPFRAWLFAVVRNYLRTELLRRARTTPVDSPLTPSEEPSDERELHEDELRALSWISDPELQLFLDRLPLAQRQVLFLRYVLDLSHEQTAAVLGRSVLDVRSLQSRALRFLRQRLAAVGRVSGQRSRRGMVRRHRHAKVLRARRFALTP